MRHPPSLGEGRRAEVFTAAEELADLQDQRVPPDRIDMVGSRAPAQARSQLADYKRHVVPKRGHCAVLLPAEPSDDSAA